ncbi:hypothetical protein FRC12_023775 [Ceratobasidium sp. 428]|nr:hypothetical protein FRC12_023775 [Ceratobasidium sp. 428]
MREAIEEELVPKCEPEPASTSMSLDQGITTSFSIRELSDRFPYPTPDTDVEMTENKDIQMAPIESPNASNTSD